MSPLRKRNWGETGVTVEHTNTPPPEESAALEEPRYTELDHQRAVARAWQAHVCEMRGAHRRLTRALKHAAEAHEEARKDAHNDHGSDRRAADAKLRDRVRTSQRLRDLNGKSSSRR